MGLIPRLYSGENQYVLDLVGLQFCMLFNGDRFSEDLYYSFFVSELPHYLIMNDTTNIINSGMNLQISPINLFNLYSDFLTLLKELLSKDIWVGAALQKISENSYGKVDRKSVDEFLIEEKKLGAYLNGILVALSPCKLPVLMDSLGPLKNSKASKNWFIENSNIDKQSKRLRAKKELVDKFKTQLEQSLAGKTDNILGPDLDLIWFHTEKNQEYKEKLMISLGVQELDPLLVPIANTSFLQSIQKEFIKSDFFFDKIMLLVSRENTAKEYQKNFFSFIKGIKERLTMPRNEGEEIRARGPLNIYFTNFNLYRKALYNLVLLFNRICSKEKEKYYLEISNITLLKIRELQILKLGSETENFEKKFQVLKRRGLEELTESKNDEGAKISKLDNGNSKTKKRTRRKKLKNKYKNKLDAFLAKVEGETEEIVQEEVTGEEKQIRKCQICFEEIKEGEMGCLLGRISFSSVRKGLFRFWRCANLI